MAAAPRSERARRVAEAAALRVAAGAAQLEQAREAAAVAKDHRAATAAIGRAGPQPSEAAAKEEAVEEAVEEAAAAGRVRRTSSFVDTGVQEAAPLPAGLFSTAALAPVK
jgi:hypothetical protein